MQSFIVDTGSPETFVALVRQEIDRRNFQDIASVAVAGDHIVVSFSWMGKTRLTYRITRRDAGFSAELERQRVSPFHAPFKAGFEERFDQILSKVGAHSPSTGRSGPTTRSGS